jgi:formylglycine-generating enzyme required for sulfatase activity
MNRIVLKTLRPGVIPAVLLVWGCASLLPGSDKIDTVIKQASDYLNESIPEGKKIVILNIKSDYPDFSRYIIDTLNADVVNARRLIVVDRSNLSEIQEEIEFQYSGEVSDDSAKALGRKPGADTIVPGAAAAIGNQWRLTVRALDVESATVQGMNNWNIPNSRFIEALTGGAVSSGSSEGGETTPRRGAIPGGFALVEGGTFTMGSPDGEGEEDEHPRHRVTVRSFYLGRREITQSEYEAVMGTNPSVFKGAELPVENVSSMDAMRYCNKRSALERLRPCYTSDDGYTTIDLHADGYRLPTEAEWEYAARGGKHRQASLYSGGDNPDTVAWYESNSDNKTHPAGTKAPNRLGIYDMSGNVSEWCWDIYGGYPKDAQNNPGIVLRKDGRYRVNRGGSWASSRRNLRLAYRDPAASLKTGQRTISFTIRRIPTHTGKASMVPVELSGGNGPGSVTPDRSGSLGFRVVRNIR